VIGTKEDFEQVKKDNKGVIISHIIMHKQAAIAKHCEFVTYIHK